MNLTVFSFRHLRNRPVLFHGCVAFHDKGVSCLCLKGVGIPRPHCSLLDLNISSSFSVRLFFFFFLGAHAQRVLRGLRGRPRGMRAVSLPAGVLQPGVVHGGRRGGERGGSVDVADDREGFFKGLVHAKHLVPTLGLLGRFLHQGVLVL